MAYDLRRGDRVWVGFEGLGGMVGAPTYVAWVERDGVRTMLEYRTVDEYMNPDADAVADMRALAAELRALCVASGATFLEDEPSG